MNVDETMSDSTATNTGPTVQQTIEAMFGAQTGSQNLSQALAAQIKSNNWNTNKFREEYEMAKSRLSDQKFNITDYPDPLLPRQRPPKQTGFDPEVEKQLKKMIASIKSGTP
ncbi:hypothetical protein QBC37DRAFT_396508 [Rhypophila decipiens]|uniref:Uncharacterized protein n=1 Tax=Rhypophila decipiens TaxID=261697 RepID=A0AAN6YGJ6_9PEZI|nr:hypothetical protein QBC37DRAFT_396508 [Rhypophila decipiens]